MFQNCAPSNYQVRLSDKNLTATSNTDLQLLEAKINDLVNQHYCAAPEDCEALPFGTKACGGPKSYITNSTNNHRSELHTLVEEYNFLDAQYNSSNNVISTCEYLMPPQDLKCIQNKCALN